MAMATVLDMTNDLHPETIAVAAGRPGELGGPLNVPIVTASNFMSGAGPEYARGDGTDTVHALEATVGALEGGRALAFSSGMAAISAVFDIVPANARILVPDDSYQGVAGVVTDGEGRLGWQVERLPTADTSAWLREIEAGADLVWLESPSNPLLEIADIPTIAGAARDAGLICVVDNTFATPLLQRPLDHGATVAIHSATKFLGGHSDLLAGVAVVTDGALGDELVDALEHRRIFGGATIGALEAFLTLRGIRTLPIRLERSQSNARELATRLASHRAVSCVRYPGLPDHPGHELAMRTLAGPGAMISFETLGNAVSADVRVSRLELIHPATSLGGVESTIERRAKLKGQESIPETLLRLSVGCEHVDDLWDDLDRALSGIV